jgi:hypothetical protein
VCVIVPKILSILAYEQVPDMEDIDMILWTYHRHMSAKELLAYLTMRFALPVPEDADEETAQFFDQYVLTLSRSLCHDLSQNSIGRICVEFLTI